MKNIVYRDQNNDIGERILNATADVTELKENKSIENVKIVDKPIASTEMKGKISIVSSKKSVYKKTSGAL